MANILVLFDSDSGNTKKMAEYVALGARAVENAQVRLLSVSKASAADVQWCDGLAVGAPTHMGILSWKMKRFWDEECQDLWGKVDGRIGCAFSSSGGWGGGNELTCQSILTVLLNFGFLVFGVPDYVADKFTLHYGAVTAGAPRLQKEKDACILLGKRLVHWTRTRESVPNLLK